MNKINVQAYLYMYMWANSEFILNLQGTSVMLSMHLIIKFLLSFFS